MTPNDYSLVPQVSTGNLSEQSADEKVKYFVSLFIFSLLKTCKSNKKCVQLRADLFTLSKLLRYFTANFLGVGLFTGRKKNHRT